MRGNFFKYFFIFTKFFSLTVCTKTGTFLAFLFILLSQVPGRQHCALLTQALESCSKHLSTISHCQQSLIHACNETRLPSLAQTFHFLVVSRTILEIKITFSSSGETFSLLGETHILLH